MPKDPTKEVETRRQRKLGRISRKIAMFMLYETYADEEEVLKELLAADYRIRAAKKLLKD